MARDVVVRLARQDAQWFSWVAILLAIILFLSLPLAAWVAYKAKLMLDDGELMQLAIRRELKQLRDLKRDLKQNAAEDAEKDSK